MRCTETICGGGLEQRQALQEVECARPDLVVMGPPCGPWSPLQNLNAHAAVSRLRAEHYAFWTFARQVWNCVHRYGGIVILEQPWS